MFSQEKFENDHGRQAEEDERSEESYTEEEYLKEDQPEEANPEGLEESDPEAGGIDYDPFTDDEAGPSPSPRESDGKCEKLFSLECSFCLRLYRSQLRPKENFSAQISGDSVQEVVANMWESGKSLTKREVRFENGVPKWASGEIPGEESAEKFLIVYDVTAHKSYATTNLTSKKLQKWRDQIVKVFVYAYSKEVETKGQYGDVLKYLINPKNPDRAGANSMREEAALAKSAPRRSFQLLAAVGYHNSRGPCPRARSFEGGATSPHQHIEVFPLGRSVRGSSPRFSPSRNGRSEYGQFAMVEANPGDQGGSSHCI
uniref:(northern house mosquito) hypothetical protein n=1 Tax=Culex pipiens TaxID=7175 RepID=A0A8D8CVA7_CULPI